jgi:argininosuccinate lyase
MKLWKGRLTGSLDESAARLNQSLAFDRRLAEYDLRGSMAWCRALGRAGLLDTQEVNQVNEGLERIAAEVQDGVFVFMDSDEDIHTAVERRLTELVGDVAGKLHTGRSRNDQVSTDFRMWMLDAIQRIDVLLLALQQTLVDRAESDWGMTLPGYTHLQQAQPVLLSHWWLSHFWVFQRDLSRMRHLQDQVRICPLGSGALAGTGFAAIDRFALAEDLGFLKPSPNSIDAVSDRDFAAEFLFCAAMMGVHASRLSEMLILFSTQEFGFISLSDEFSTGSSLMPHKKNPDPLELIRAKSGVLTGLLAGLLATLKGLPSAYDKDLQEDKVPVFTAADSIEMVLAVLSGAVRSLQVNPHRMLWSIDPFAMTTDLADALVERGLPFRQAYSLVGQAVQRSIELGVSLPDMALEEWQALIPDFIGDLLQVFDVQRSLARRAAWGGTAPDAVLEQLKLARKTLVETSLTGGE